jgi:lysophospholipase L1-like esterase
MREESRLGQWRRRYVTAAVIFLNTVALIVILNLTVTGSWGVARLWGARSQFGVPAIDRYGFDRMLLAYPAWERQNLVQLLKEREDLERFEYAPLTEVRVAARQGRFVNVSSIGYRYGKDQGPWPPDPAALTVFVFGGSTAFGDGLADGDALPSQLQEMLLDENPSRRVRIYNFACPGYMSTQERIVFEQLLLIGMIPDVAIFFDGLNDVVEGDRAVPPYLCGGNMTRILRSLVEQYHQRDDLLPQLLTTARDLPAVQMFSELAQRVWPSKSTSEDSSPVRIVQHWQANRSMIEATAREFGVQTLFVWQPVPFYRYDLRYHLFPEDVPHHGESFPNTYELMRREFETGRAGDRFLWLADMQADKRENLYVDSCHYTAAFTRQIAREIQNALEGKKLLVKRPESAPSDGLS